MSPRNMPQAGRVMARLGLHVRQALVRRLDLGLRGIIEYQVEVSDKNDIQRNIDGLLWNLDEHIHTLTMLRV